MFKTHVLGEDYTRSYSIFIWAPSRDPLLRCLICGLSEVVPLTLEAMASHMRSFYSFAKALEYLRQGRSHASAIRNPMTAGSYLLLSLAQGICHPLGVLSDCFLCFGICRPLGVLSSGFLCVLGYVTPLGLCLVVFYVFWDMSPLWGFV